MSHHWIAPQFSSGSYDTGTQRWNFGDLSPDDCVLQVVFHRLRSDAKLQALFGTQFDLCWTRPYTTQNVPMLQVYSASLDQEERRPTEVSKQFVPVGIAVVHDANPDSIVPIAGYSDKGGTVQELEPGLSTLVHYIKQLLRQGRQLAIKRHDGLDVCLARSSELGRSTGFGEVDERSNIKRWVHEIQWVYEVNVNNNTGRIIALE